MTQKYCLLGVILLLLPFLAFGAGQAETTGAAGSEEAPAETAPADAEYVIRVAYQDPPNPLGSVNSAFMSVFELKVEEFTGGRVDVQLFPSGQLGSDLDNYMRVKAGELEMSGAGTGSLANALYPPLGIFDLPFLFPDNITAFEVLDFDNPFVERLNNELKEEAGIGVIAFIPQSFRNITNDRRAIRSPADLAGLKMRTMQVRPHMAMMSAAGAQVVPIAFTELYTSLETGVVDGQENPLSNIRAMNFFEVQKYLTMSKHAINVSAPIYNVAWFEGLPAEIQSGIRRAAAAARTASVGAAFLSDLTNIGYFRQAGVEVYIPTPAEMAEFRRVMQPDALKWFRDNVDGGAELLVQLQREIEKASGQY